MKVVCVASEINPFASTGGLGEFGESLPKSLVELGIEVCRIMPFYRQVAEGGFSIRDTGVRLDIPVGFKVSSAEVWGAETPAPPTYFIRKDEYFDRTHLYGLLDRDYDDNFERFVFFQKAAVAVIDTLAIKPDIVHCVDWQTGLVPLFLKNGIHGMGRNAAEKTVFTIHNLAYQGVFPGAMYSLTNLPFGCFNVDTLEFYGNINCTKAGITTSDAVTMPSKMFAQEAQTELAGFGLHGVLFRASNKLTGIVNGVDYSVWDPRNDPFIAAPYSIDDLTGKARCKEALLKETGLTVQADKPLLGMVSRLVDYKGLDILAEAMERIVQMGVGFVLLGIGAEKHHNLCKQWMERWPGQFFAKLGYDTGFAHRIEAGADIYIMPSRFEPNGQNQLYSLRYGTIPVVHGTGALEDTIKDISADAGEGTGFKFSAYSSEALLATIKRAVEMYAQRDLWVKIMQRAMREDFSWVHAARAYEVLFKSLIS